MTAAIVEAPDVETSSEAYARRFDGAAGAFMLSRQQLVVSELLAGLSGATILEVGGGHAQLCGALAESGHHVTVMGSDERCRRLVDRDRRNARVEFVTGSLLALPFGDDSFDIVIAIRLMAHIEDWPRLIGEMCRVARRTIVIDYPAWVSSNALSLPAFGLKKWIEGDTRPYRSFWGHEIGREILRCGWRVHHRRGQLMLPLALHRLKLAGTAMRRLELAFAWCGLTGLFGNPVLLRADAGHG